MSFRTRPSVKSPSFPVSALTFGPWSVNYIGSLLHCSWRTAQQTAGKAMAGPGLWVSHPYRTEICREGKHQVWHDSAEKIQLIVTPGNCGNLYMDLFYYLNPKVKFTCHVLAGSRVHKTGWNSKCRCYEIFNSSTLFSHCLVFLSVLKISGFSSSFSSENLLTVMISYCKKGWKIWHLNIITLWHVLPEQKLTPHTSQKQNLRKEQL